MGRREAFLLWLLAGLLSWQAAVFTYGVHLCSRVSAAEIGHVCPSLGDRFDTYVNTSLGAVLGLLAGSVTSRKP
jgi:hypothetical protein